MTASTIRRQEIKITGGDAIVAVRNAAARRQGGVDAPRFHLALVDLKVWREDEVVILQVAFGKVGEVTIRLSRHWAKTVMLKLQKAVQ